MTKTLVLVLMLLSSVTFLQINPFTKDEPTTQHSAAFASTVILVPESYTSIQEAIDAASPGDTVHVNNGTYYENVYVNKTITLAGESPEGTIIDGSKSNSSFNPVVSLYGEDAKNVILNNFTIRGSSNATGIYILACPNTTISNNIISNNHGGIVVDASDNNTFVNNTIANNAYEGLLLFQSSGNTMKNNIINENTYNFGVSESTFSNDIDESNLINGKPIRYLKNQTGVVINPITYPDIGYLALIDCSDVIVENLNLTNNCNGILLAQTENTTLINNTFTGNVEGVSIYNSANNTLQDNNITNNWQGITLTNSPNNTFKQNRLTANQQHLKIVGTHLSHFLQEIDTSNTVDTKLIRYVINQNDLTITPYTFPNTGCLGLVNCHNITVEELSTQNSILLVAFSQNSTIAQNTIAEGGVSLQYVSSINVSTNSVTGGDSAITINHSDNNTIVMNNITKNSEYGILFESSTGNTVLGNTISESKTGISLDTSANNSIIGNNVIANEYYGINLWNSSYNTVYHNNFVNNSRPGWQAVCSCSSGLCDNTWDNGYPSGGNYWSDYNGTDEHSGTKQNANGSDAVGDVSYGINFAQKDNYPLTGKFHDFTVNMTQAYDIEIISNSSVTNFTVAEWLSSPTQYLQPGQQFLWFFTAGETNTTGFCRVTAPRDLLNGTYVVLVDWNPVPVVELAESNSTHVYIYFTYGQSDHGIIIISEYPMITTLLITIMIITTIVTIMAKKRNKPKTKAFHHDC